MLLVSGVLAGVAEHPPSGLPASLNGYRVFWPQDWRFFTGLDLPEQSAYPVTTRDGVPAFVIRPRQASDWSWGLDRGSDPRATETWIVASRIPDEFWQDCATDCAPDYGRVHRMASPLRRPGLCGVVAIVSSHRPTPAPGALPDAPRRKVALTDLTCPR